MIQKKNKGSALIVVIMVIAVMTILGMSILNISLSETMQASNEDKRLQAHYLARAGAEATLSAWKNAPIGNKPVGACSPVYLNSSNQFVNVSSNMIGKFDVEITNPNSVTTIINSVGTVGEVVQTTTVTIRTITTEITDPIGATVSGVSLNWYGSNNDQVSAGTHEIGPVGTTVLVGGSGLKIVHGPAVYQADTINFTTDIKNFHHPLTLNAGTIIFNKLINTNTKKGGYLILKVLPSAAVTRTDKPGQWGRVEYNSQWYYYPNILNGTEIKTDADFDKLDKIPILDPNFPDAPKQQISSYSITWS